MSNCECTDCACKKDGMGGPYEIGWLIEWLDDMRTGRQEYLTLAQEDGKCMLGRTPDSKAAVRFVRKRDAEQVKEFVEIDGKLAFRVAEHMWGPGPEPRDYSVRDPDRPRGRAQKIGSSDDPDSPVND